MAKVRIYDLAKELKISPKDLLDMLASVGVHNKLASSSIEEKAARYLRQALLDRNFPIPLSPEPSNRNIIWVLVAGTALQTLPDDQKWLSREIGEALARHGFRLLIGSDNGVDNVVTRAFVSELTGEAQRKGEWLKQIAWGDTVSELAYGSPIRVPNGTDGYLDAARLADAAIIVGGRGGTGSVARAAMHLGLPVIPIESTGGDAKRLFGEIRATKESNPLRNVPAEWEKLLLNPVASPSVAREVADGIIKILQFLSVSDQEQQLWLEREFSSSSSVPNQPNGARGEAYGVDQNPSVTPSPTTPGQFSITHILQRDPPPSEVLSLTITSGPVILQYGGEKYTGPCRIDSNKLKSVAYSPEQYGELLFNSVIHQEFSPGGAWANSTWAGYQSARRHNPSPLRIEIFLDPEDKMLPALHWEFLKAPGENPLAILDSTTFHRRLQSNFDVRSTRVNKLRVLIAICNPRGLGDPEHTVLRHLCPLNEAKERAIIETALHRLADQNSVEYEILDSGNGPVTLSQLGQRLEEGFHALHLVAHGFYSPEKDRYNLVLANEVGNCNFVSGEEFQATLGQRVRLAVLAACQSADSRIPNSLLALGPSLVRGGVAAVIAMQESISVVGAQLFSQYFYDDFARTGCVDSALTATRKAMYLQNPAATRPRDWGIPVLLMATANGQLLIPGQEMGSATPLAPSDLQFPDFQESALQTLPQKVAQWLNEQDTEETVARVITQSVARALSNAFITEMPGNSPIVAGYSEVDEIKQDRRPLTSAIRQPVSLTALELSELATQRGLNYPTRVFEQLAFALNSGKHIILTGPPGTGKTSLAEVVAAVAHSRQMNNGTICTTATADWSTFDTVGGFLPGPHQQLRFQPGVVLQSICDAKWLIVDELNRADLDKAFGQLFTVLSGQTVDLGLQVKGMPVRVVAGRRSPNHQTIMDMDNWWDLNDIKTDLDYVVHPNWRLIGTMNEYDRASLYNLSFAFMRRFAQIEVAIPEQDVYLKLLSVKLNTWLDPTFVDGTEGFWTPLVRALVDGELNPLLFADGPVMRARSLGPAIMLDILKYLGHRLLADPGLHDSVTDGRASPPTLELLGEAFLLYATPQLDGLDHENCLGVYGELRNRFGGEECLATKAILGRIRAYYPHIEGSQWELVS